jgi:hypothetical protein
MIMKFQKWLIIDCFNFNFSNFFNFSNYMEFRPIWNNILYVVIAGFIIPIILVIIYYTVYNNYYYGLFTITYTSIVTSVALYIIIENSYFYITAKIYGIVPQQ